MNYIIYDNDGNITLTGSCSAENWNLISVSAGETIMEGTADLLTQKVSDNELINLMTGKVKKSQINKNNIIGDVKLEVINVSFKDPMNNIKKLSNVTAAKGIKKYCNS